MLSTIEGNPNDERASIGRRRLVFFPGIQIRNQIGWLSDFTLDRDGERYEEGGFSTGRVRWNPTLQFGPRFKLVGMLDLANGRWAPAGSEDPVIDALIEQGSPPDRTSLEAIDPRELYIEARLPFGVVRLGQQAFTWGPGDLGQRRQQPRSLRRHALW